MRTKNHWNVTLQRDDGQIVEQRVSAFWDPAQEGCNEAVMRTGKAEAWAASNRQHEFAPISAALIGADGEPEAIAA